MLNIIPYGGKYPVALRALMDDAGVGRPKQERADFTYLKGVDITYTLGWGPKTLRKYEPILLGAIEEDTSRYEEAFSGTDLYYLAVLEIGLAKKKGVEREHRGLSTVIWAEPEGLVWGKEGSGKKCLNTCIEELKGWYKKYELPKGFKNLYVLRKVVVSVRERPL